tara:strand:- start:84 stop:314 length:231 start_codon:yes stop_codon:yes gene_type:complete
MYHCIVIDNEYSARERISSFVEEQDSWQVDGQSIEYKEAVYLLIKHQPDMCFMDINIIRGLTAGYRVQIYIPVKHS